MASDSRDRNVKWKSGNLPHIFFFSIISHTPTSIYVYSQMPKTNTRNKAQKCKRFFSFRFVGAHKTRTQIRSCRSQRTKYTHFFRSVLFVCFMFSSFFSCAVAVLILSFKKHNTRKCFFLSY